MLSRLRITASVGLAAFIAVAVYIAGRQPADEGFRPTEPAGRAETLAGKAGPAAVANGLRPSTASPRASSTAGLVDAYNKAGSWRPSVWNAAKMAELGGAFYAERMLSFCKGMAMFAGASSVSGPEPRTPERNRASEAISERCGEFVFSDYEQIHALSADSKDPLVRAGKQLQDARSRFAKDPAARGDLQVAIQDILASRDPLLIDSTGLRLLSHRSPDRRSPAFYFAGESYIPGAAPDVGIALHLVPCELGLVCDENEPRAQMRCASGAGCEGGRYLEAQWMLQGKPKEYEQIRSLARAMADAVRRGDAAAFMPP